MATIPWDASTTTETGACRPLRDIVREALDMSEERREQLSVICLQPIILKGRVIGPRISGFDLAALALMMPDERPN